MEGRKYVRYKAAKMTGYALAILKSLAAIVGIIAGGMFVGAGLSQMVRAQPMEPSFASLDPQATDELDKASATEDVKRWLSETQGLRAQFVQQGADGSFLTGTFTMRQPGRIRFDYSDATDLLIVADGKAVYFIDYEVRQLSRYPLKETPLAPLLDNAALESLALSVTPVMEGPMAGTIAVTSQDPKHREYGTLTMMFDRVDGADGKLLLQAWTVLEAQGNLTQVTLRDQEENVSVADSLFTFKDPRRRRPGSRTR